MIHWMLTMAILLPHGIQVEEVSIHFKNRKECETTAAKAAVVIQKKNPEVVRGVRWSCRKDHTDV